MPFIFLIAVMAVILALTVWPVQWAAAVVGARRLGFGSSLLALICASVLYMVGLEFPRYGVLAAFFLSAAGFSAVLGVNYPKGLAIAVLHAVFSLLIAMVAGLVVGVGLLGPMVSM